MGYEAALAEANPGVVLADTVFLSVPSQSASALGELRASLLRTKGVLGVKSSSDGKSLAVTFIPSVVSGKQIVQVVPAGHWENATAERQLGTPEEGSASQASDVVLRLRIEGMTCHSCTSTIEGKIGKLQGVTRIKGNWKASVGVWLFASCPESASNTFFVLSSLAHPGWKVLVAELGLPLFILSLLLNSHS